MKSVSLFFLGVMWILVTIASNAIAMAYSFSLIQGSNLMWHEYLLRGLFLGGLLSGLGQWVLIKSQLKGTWTWILANALGMPLGFVLGHYLYSGFAILALAITRRTIPFDWLSIAYDWPGIVYPIGVISVAGTAFGALQWFVLKNKVRLAYWWIPVSILSWNIGLYLAEKVSHLLIPVLRNYPWNISGIIFGIVLGTIVGGIGAVSIVIMLGSSQQPIYQTSIEHPNTAS